MEEDDLSFDFEENLTQQQLQQQQLQQQIQQQQQLEQLQQQQQQGQVTSGGQPQAAGPVGVAPAASQGTNSNYRRNFRQVTQHTDPFTATWHVCTL